MEYPQNRPGELDSADPMANPYQSPATLSEYDRPRLNPWFSMWVKPRATMRQILDTNPNEMVWALVSISGIGEALQNASGSGIIEYIPLPGVLGLCVVLGPILGVIGWVISTFLTLIAGRWLGGVGGWVEVRSAMAWGGIPGIWGMLTWIPLIVVFRSELFAEGFGSSNLQPVYIGATGIWFVTGIWSFIVLLKCVGEAHQFSAWRAWGAMILGGFVVAAGLLLIGITIFAIAAALGSL